MARSLDEHVTGRLVQTDAGEDLTESKVRPDEAPDEEDEDEEDAAAARLAQAEAGRRFRDAQQRLDALPAQLAQAQGALTIAQREVYLANRANTSLTPVRR